MTTNNPNDNDKPGRTEVWNDVEGPNRRECWTDGEWIRVGRNINDDDLCLIFRADDSYYDEFRYANHPEKFQILDEDGQRHSYIVDSNGHLFRFYKGDKIVLKVTDHELGTIRAAYKLANEYKKEQFNWTDHAEVFLENLLPDRYHTEIWSNEITDDQPKGQVELIDSLRPNKVNEELIEELKNNKHISWKSVRAINDENTDQVFKYVFTLNTMSVMHEKDQKE